MFRRNEESTSAGPSRTETRRNINDGVIETPPNVVNAELPRRRWTLLGTTWRFAQLFVEEIELNSEMAYHFRETAYHLREMVYCLREMVNHIRAVFTGEE